MHLNWFQLKKKKGDGIEKYWGIMWTQGLWYSKASGIEPETDFCSAVLPNLLTSQKL